MEASISDDVLYQSMEIEQITDNRQMQQKINAATYYNEKSVEDRSKQFRRLEEEKARTVEDSATGFSDITRDAIIPKKDGERGTFLENVTNVAVRSFYNDALLSRARRISRQHMVRGSVSDGSNRWF